MNEGIALLLALCGGVLLGLLFFGGLRWTVQKGMASRNPGLWFFVSLLFRVAVTVIGFYFIAANDWKRALMCAIGFFAVRVVMIRNALKAHE